MEPESKPGDLTPVDTPPLKKVKLEECEAGDLTPTDAPAPLAAVSVKKEEPEEEDTDWVVNCICGLQTDDGNPMICCDTCATWQHLSCLQINANKKESTFERSRFICSWCDTSGSVFKGKSIGELKAALVEVGLPDAGLVAVHVGT